MKGTCSICGLPVHTELIDKPNGKKVSVQWLHDDYRVAWQVDEQGRARTLHFAKAQEVKTDG